VTSPTADPAGTEYPHLLPHVRPLAALADDERVARVQAERWINHRAASLALDLLQEALEQPHRERMENILLLGESGMGKTMLLRKFERAHAHPFDKSSGIECRAVLMMRMPHEPTEEAFVGQLLAALHAPASEVGTRRQTWGLRERAFRLLREVGVQVLVIDEINSVLVGTPRQQRLFLQLLRFMSNELSVALVCAGVPEARHALLSDAQLRSRFTDIELQPWRADAELQRFVNLLVAGLALRRPSPVDSAKVRRLLAERTGGVTLSVTKVIERAAVAAIRSGRECVDLTAIEDEHVWRGIAPTALTLHLRGRGARVGA
jgi:type II secretory pathway predicted ATPase ExeA